jgi:2,4-dienoyl-CoA reductase-like NADH-dependent reductase (Old Yellow Enzyme family)
MSNQYSHFLSNLQIRGKVWKNRSVAAPMGGIETENGQLKDEIVQTVRFYGQGSPAEYIVGETPVNVEGFRGPAPMAFHFDDEANRPAIQKYADLIHEETGALAMIELCHCGDSKTPNTGSRIVGPSSYIREDGAFL